MITTDTSYSQSFHAFTAAVENEHRMGRQLGCEAADAPEFTAAKNRVEAAHICGDCPIAAICRQRAADLHASHQEYRATQGTRNENGDPYGVTGCWGGWWFDRVNDARQILSDTEQAMTGHTNIPSGSAAPVAA